MEKRNRSAYFAQRRLELRQRALKAVTDFNERPVECFRCGQTKGVLGLDHLFYTSTSVKYGHSDLRSREAIKFPSRFYILCKNCHIAKDLHDIGPHGMHADSHLGSQVRAFQALMKRREDWARIIKERDGWRQVAMDALTELENVAMSGAGGRTEGGSE